MRILDRRRFAKLVAGTALGFPPAAFAAVDRPPLIGFFSSRSKKESSGIVDAFLTGLAENGLVPGKNCEIIYRWAEGRYDQLPALISDLLVERPAVVLSSGGPPALVAAIKATQQVPIVFPSVSGADRLGIVRSLGRPGGNVTGIKNMSVETTQKCIALLLELRPEAKKVGVLTNPASPHVEFGKREAMKGAVALGVSVETLGASDVTGIEQAFAKAATLELGGMVVLAEPFFDSHRSMIVRLARRFSMPSLYQWRDYVDEGGLISYGNNLNDMYRQVANYVARILRGSNPGDLPVMEATKFELIFNRTTARELGIDPPRTILARADELIG